MANLSSKGNIASVDWRELVTSGFGLASG